MPCLYYRNLCYKLHDIIAALQEESAQMKRDSEAQFCGFHVCFFFRYFYSNLFFFYDCPAEISNSHRIQCCNAELKGSKGNIVYKETTC